MHTNYRLILFLIFVLNIQGCSHLFYLPSKTQFYDPADQELVYQDIYFDSGDKIRLHGWFFPAKNPKGTIVHFHGNAQNLTSHFMNLSWVVAEGFNLFIFDYRGYGKSDGIPTQKGVHVDAIAAINKGLELRDENGKGLFIIYGQSLGAVISLKALSQYDQKKVDLIVQESAFSSYQDIASDRLRTRWYSYLLSPLAYMLVSDEYGSEKILDQIVAPTLVIVGEKDRIVPNHFGKDIFKKIKSEKKWFWCAPEAQHIGVFFTRKAEYRLRFIELLDSLASSKRSTVMLNL